MLHCVTAKRIVLSMVLLIGLLLAVGCCSNGNNTLSSNPSGYDINVFSSYVYAPTPEISSLGSQTTDKKVRATANKDFIVLLQDSTSPDGYEAVKDATICLANNPADILTETDKQGKFSLSLDDLPKNSKDGCVSVIVNPPHQGKFKNLSSCCHDIYPWNRNPQITQLLLHPDARNIYVGQVTQLYAKAKLANDSCNLIPADRVQWRLDDQTIASISSTGVLRGFKSGVVNVTITYGSHTCTGKVHVKATTSPTYLLKGIVYDANHKPVKNAVVKIKGLDIVGITDMKGLFSISGLPGDDELPVAVYVNGVCRFTQVIKLTSNLTDYVINLPADGLLPGAIEGKVTSEGAPLAGVLISNGISSVQTQTDGSYRFSDLPPTTYSFSFTKAGYVSVNLKREIQPGKTVTFDVQMVQDTTVPTGTLNGTVKSGGVNVEGAVVAYSALSGSTITGVTVTGADGAFSVMQIAAGVYRLTITKEGYQDRTVDVTVQEGEETNTLVLLEIQPPADLDPVITSISPATGYIGDTITITGERFDAGGTVKFGDTAVTSVISWSDSEIQCTVPFWCLSGPVTVSVGGHISNNDKIFTRLKKWRSPGIIDAGAGNDANPDNEVFPYQVITDKNKNSICVFLQSDGANARLYANRYASSSNSWTGATLIDAGAGQNASSPQLVEDSNGNAVCAFVQSDGVNFRLYVNHYNAQTQNWSGAVTIDNGPGSNASQPFLAIDANGNVFCAFQQVSGGISHVYINRYYLSADAWIGSTRLDTGVTDATNPTLAFDSNRNAMCVYYQDHGLDGAPVYRVVAHSYNAQNCVWSAGTFIDPVFAIAWHNPLDADSPQVIFDHNGDAYAVFYCWDGDKSKNILYANKFSAGSSSWGVPEIICTEMYNDRWPTLAVNSNNNVIVAYRPTDGFLSRTYANCYNALSNSWEGAVPIDNGAFSSGIPNVVFDSTDTALCFFHQRDVTSLCHMYLTMLPSLGDSWSSPISLEEATGEDAGSNGIKPAVSLDTEDNVTVIYWQVNGANRRVYAVRYY